MKDQSAAPKFGAGRRSKYRRGAPDTGVQAITNAAVPHSEDMHHRMVQYAVTMGIRMVCLAAIFVFDGWFKIVPIVGAVVLPWVAVMIANGGSDISAQETVELLDEAPQYSLPAADPDLSDGVTSPGDILTGELVPDSDGDPGAHGDAQAGPQRGADSGPAHPMQPAPDAAKEGQFHEHP